MDAETFYIGKEIQDAGFANLLQIINESAPGNSEARAAMIASAEMSIAAAKKKLEDANIPADEWEQAAALLETAMSGGDPRK
jgi:hypothetical protein